MKKVAIGGVQVYIERREEGRQRPLKYERPIYFTILRLVLWALEPTGLSDPRHVTLLYERSVRTSFEDNVVKRFLRDQNPVQTIISSLLRFLFSSSLKCICTTVNLSVNTLLKFKTTFNYINAVLPV